MKQPILFKSRIIDLAEVTENMLGEVLPSYGTMPYALAFRLTFLDATELERKFIDDFFEESYGSTLSELEYKRLEQPYAVNKLTGEFHPVLNLEFTECGKLDGAILFDSDKSTPNSLVYWSDINSPLYCFKTKRRESADIEILYDGWFE